MEKFITLNHLKKAVDALLLKINNEKQYYVEKTSVEAASSEGYLIGSVGGIDLYAPSNLLTQNDLNDIYDYIDNSPFLTGNEVSDANDYVNKRLCLKTINTNNGGNLYLYFPNNSEHSNTAFIFTLGTATTRTIGGFSLTIYTDSDGQYSSFNSKTCSMTVIDKKGQEQLVLKNKTIYFLSWTLNSPYVATFTELDMVSSSDLSEAITDALSNITGFSAEVVNQLPVTGELGVFYFVSNSGSGNNIYDEYIYVNNNWEKIGTTEVDLSNYLQKTDIADWAKAATKPTYTATEVGALPSTTVIPSKVSDLSNDAGYLTSFTETDPTVPTWAKAATKPTYTAGEVGAVPQQTSGNNKNTTISSSYDTGISLMYDNDSDPTNSIELKNNGITIQSSGRSGSNTIEINNNSTKIHNIITPTENGDAANKLYVDNKFASITPSSIGALPATTVIPTVPTNVSAFNNDAGYLTSFTETDPTVPAWAKEENKPTYTALEVGAIADTAPAAAITQANITAWNNKADTNTTYSLSISGTRITLTPSSGSATYVDLPVYDGGII